MTTPMNRAMRRAFITLVILGILMNGAVLLISAHSVNTIRGTFCTFATSVNTAAHGLPQVPARVQAEAAYVRLQRQLKC